MMTDPTYTKDQLIRLRDLSKQLGFDDDEAHWNRLLTELDPDK